jgi:hypothetical protein
MEIVIDIPEIMYGAIKEYGITFLSRDDKKTLRKSIANGTPLPEHHGRLIDESKITKCYMPINQLDVRGIRTDAPTIIEGSESE